MNRAPSIPALYFLAVLLIPASLESRLQPVCRAADPDWFPFVIPWDDASQTITDVSFLNPAPAGGNGFIRARNGHLYDEKNNRVRFLGVNFTFSANFPDKTDALKIAARLHKYGFNIVRLHHMDYFHAPAGIFDPKFKDKQHLDKEQLDRLDYFIYQLKQHGIYTNINLHVSRAFTAADGFPDTDRLPGLGKDVDFFEPRMIELQKNYARDLLTHVNPYTQARYVDEPAVAVVEINNENTLLGAAWDETLYKLPPHYQRELSRQWSAWLKTKYGDTAGLKSAWKVVRPLGPNLLRNADFADGTRHWKLEVHPGAAATVQTPKEVLPPSGEKVARIEVKTPGKQNWHIQFNQSGLDLVDGQAYTVSFWAKANRKRILTVNAGLDKEDWHSIGLSGRRNLDTECSRFTLVFTAPRPLKQHNRLTFVVGDEAGAVDLAGLSLQQGVETVFPSGASLEAGNIPLSKPVPGPAGHDWISFLIHSERKYQKAMLDYIKKDLG